MRKTVVGDNRQELREALEHALSHTEMVVCSGGLGPTEDDLTRETVAELLGRKLQRNEEILRGIQERFRKFGRAMPETNVRQAMVPRHTRAYYNACALIAEFLRQRVRPDEGDGDERGVEFHLMGKLYEFCDRPIGRQARRLLPVGPS